MSLKLEKKFIIENNAGLHARAAALLVQCTSRFKSHVEIKKDDETVNGKSIMGVMMLAAVKGSDIFVQVEGEDAQMAMDALTDLIARKFDED